VLKENNQSFLEKTNPFQFLTVEQIGTVRENKLERKSTIDF